MDVLDSLIINSTNIEPSCWDGIPSSRYFGEATQH